MLQTLLCLFTIPVAVKDIQLSYLIIVSICYKLYYVCLLFLWLLKTFSYLISLLYPYVTNFIMFESYSFTIILAKSQVGDSNFGL